MTVPLWAFIVLLVFAVIGATWCLFCAGIVALAVSRHRGTRRYLNTMRARHARMSGLQHAVDVVSARHHPSPQARSDQS